MQDEQLKDLSEPAEEIEVNLGEDDEDEVEESTPELVGQPFDVNLAEFLDEDVLQIVGQERQEKLTDFKNMRNDWEERIKRGIRWLGMGTDDGTGEDILAENACTAVHPLLMENVVKFQAKAIQELWPAKGPVRTKVRGYVDLKREQQAARVRAFMNYQLTEKVPGFYADLERNLFRVGFMGTGIRKVGWNAATGSPDPTIVNIEDFYIDPAVTHLRHSEEHIEIVRLSDRKLTKYKQNGMFRENDADVESIIQPNEISQAIEEAQGFQVATERQGHVIGEAHCYLNLDGCDPLVPDDVDAPYIVHFNVETGFVYAIRRNWDEQDANMGKKLWYSVDQLIPAFGFYGLGFVHLIGDLAASSTATLRALVDAGQVANWPGGYKSQDAKIVDTDAPLGFGEFRDVNISPEELQKAFFPLPVKEPSQVLFALLQFMVESGQKFADTTDQVVSESTNYGPVATTLALLEASQRFYSSIHKRLHESQREFFQLVGFLNWQNLPDRVPFVAGGENSFVMREDFHPDVVDILPASDPNAMTESQRVAKAQVELEMAARFPQMHNMQEALLRFYLAMGTESPEKLLVNPEAQAISADPLSELQAAMRGKPIKGAMGQDHQAHIAVKEAFLAQPQMQGVNDPTIAVGVQLIKANIAEHKTLMFIAQVMAMAQQQGLPPQDEKVQAVIAQKLMQMSAENGMQQPLNVEVEMLKNQQKELLLADKRIESQNVRDAAAIAQKNREIDLKERMFEAEQGNAVADRRMTGAKNVLDFEHKAAQSAQAMLLARAKKDAAD